MLICKQDVANIMIMLVPMCTDQGMRWSMQCQVQW